MAGLGGDCDIAGGASVKGTRFGICGEPDTLDIRGGNSRRRVSLFFAPCLLFWNLAHNQHPSLTNSKNNQAHHIWTLLGVIPSCCASSVRSTVVGNGVLWYTLFRISNCSCVARDRRFFPPDVSPGLNRPSPSDISNVPVIIGSLDK